MNATTLLLTAALAAPAFADGKPLAEFAGHTRPIQTLALAPDGKTAASAGADLVIRLWDVATGKELRRLEGHRNGVMGVAFSPDGKRIASCAQDGTTRRWEVATGQELWEATGPKSMPMAVAVSPDGQTIATGYADGWIYLHEAATGKESKTFQAPKPSVFHALAFTPDGKHLLTAHPKLIRVWDLAAGNSRTIEGHTSFIGAVAVSPDGRRILTGGWDRTVRLRDFETGKELRLFTGHGDKVSAVAFLGDGKRVVSAAADMSARVWDADTGKEDRVLEGHKGPVKAIAATPDGRLLLTADGGNSPVVKVWELSPLAKEPAPPAPAAVASAAIYHQNDSFSRYWTDGKAARFVSTHYHGESKVSRLQVFDLVTGKPVGPVVTEPKFIFCAAFSPDGKRVAFGSAEKTVRVIDAATGKDVFPPITVADVPRYLVFTPDGSLLLGNLFNTEEQKIRVWSAATGRDAIPPFDVRTLPIQTSALRDGTILVAAGGLQFWDSRTGKKLREVKYEDAYVRTFTVSADATRVALGMSPYGDAGNEVRVVETSTGKAVGAPLKHGNTIEHVAFSPDGKRAATCSLDNTARLWDVASGKPLCEPLKQSGVVSHAAFSPDGKRFATGGFDGTVRVRDAATAALIAEGQGSDWLKQVRFSPDGKHVYGLPEPSGTSAALVYDAATGKLVRTTRVKE